ncbi:Galactokinase [Gloeophyllum trabeum ATCC 11539]|uniref:Galactokinase n=1 Tax=Gloeophyllum trabeum (strain ATCC 11539 / FP-39264 / Madison 617) TaxID=670483 RepID=S7RIQ6_GLOTA|nr:Galactokinase [Gloeophyllum trabeum ATCC 11539]EPQ52469.1 Galactokinase [Gloeophyllum trabeum ATCC 11539]
MAASLPIPVFNTLEEAYSSLGSALDHAPRWDNLAVEFESRFGRKPAFIARAPGRVNLIGEHIDYALFGVLPAAVERDILIACAPRSTTEQGAVRAENLAGSKYPPRHFAPSFKNSAWHLDIDKTQLNWESYVKAGYYGVLNTFFASGEEQPVPVDILVTGSVPAGSGLSSSAAMVVASTLTFLAVNNKLTGVSKGRLVELAMENEKRVGVNSGGMDQAASVISLPNSALYITFFPTLSAEPIPLPSGSSPAVPTESTTTTAPSLTTSTAQPHQASTDPHNTSLAVEVPAASAGGVFVCANSLVVSDKVVGARTRYNLRVVETLVAARVLCRILGLPLDEDISGKRERVTLREVVGRYLGVKETKGGEPLLSTAQLHKGLSELGVLSGRLRPGCWKADAGENTVLAQGAELGVSMEEMVEMSGLEKDEFHETYLSWVDVEAPNGRFQLYKRAAHVFSEALRVLQFRQACLQGRELIDNKPNAPVGENATKAILEVLGALMNESMESCSKLYECSCPELDQLTTICREAGAYGSRLTGAGWGGCTVSLVAESQVQDFIARVKAAYPPYKNLEGEQLKEVIFATKPSSGAFVYKFD